MTSLFEQTLLKTLYVSSRHLTTLSTYTLQKLCEAQAHELSLYRTSYRHQQPSNQEATGYIQELQENHTALFTHLIDKMNNLEGQE